MNNVIVFLMTLLLMFTSFLFADGDGISDVVGYVRYDLVNNGVSGYNLISLPLGDVLNCSSIFERIPNCETISKWNSVSQAWDTYDQTTWQSTWTIDSGYTYMVHVSENDTLYTLGSIPASPVFNLKTGDNLIMLPLDKSSITNSSQLMSDIPNCDKVAKWDADTQSWVYYDGATHPTTWSTSIGQGYMVNVSADTQWPTVRNNVRAGGEK